MGLDNNPIHEEILEVLPTDNISNLPMVDKAGNVIIEGIVRRKALSGKLNLCDKIYRNNLLPNGDVVMCYSDWSLKHIIGNLGTDNYLDMFKGEKFLKIIEQFSETESDLLCRLCSHANLKN